MGTIAAAALVLVLGQPAQNQTDYAAIRASANDLQNQLDFMAHALSTIPGRMHRGFNKQISTATIDLATLDNLAAKNARRGDLDVAFVKLDAELGALLSELEPFSKWEPAVAMSIRRVQSSLNDFQLAMTPGHLTPERRAQLQRRQIQSLLYREAELESMAKIVFEDAKDHRRWKDDFAELRAESEKLRRLQKDNAGPEDLQKQFVKIDGTWQKIAGRIKESKNEDAGFLHTDMQKVDRVMANLAPLFGIQDHRPTLIGPPAPLKH